MKLSGITTAHESMDTRHILVATLVCIPVGLFARTYDPSAVLLGSQATHRRIRGLDIWRSNQAYMLVIRAATVLLLTSRSYTWPPLEGFLGRIQPTLFLASLLAQILVNSQSQNVTLNPAADRSDLLSFSTKAGHPSSYSLCSVSRSNLAPSKWTILTRLRIPRDKHLLQPRRRYRSLSPITTASSKMAAHTP